MLSLRADKNISVLAAAVTALAILFCTKVSGYLLPSAFYFSISSVFKTDDSMMFLSYPGVTANQFCKLMHTYKVDPQDLDFNWVTCDDKKLVAGEWGTRLSSAELNEIYKAWLDSHIELVATVGKAANSVTPKMIYEELQDGPVLEGRTANEAVREFRNQLDGALSRAEGTTVKRQIDATFTAALEKIGDPGDDNDALPMFGDTLKFGAQHSAELAKAATIKAIETLQKLKISVADIDISNAKMRQIATGSYSGDDFLNGVQRFYIQSNIDLAVNDALKFLDQEGLPVKATAAGVEKVRTAVVYENLPTYIAAAIIRLLIVAFASFVCATVFRDRADPTTIGIGGALAGVLLVWPVVTLWDFVVREEWQGMKLWFIVTYVVYVISLFYAAKTSAMISQIVERQLWKGRRPASLQMGDEALERGIVVTARDILQNCAATLLLAVISYGLNLLIPING